MNGQDNSHTEIPLGGAINITDVSHDFAVDKNTLKTTFPPKPLNGFR